VREAVARCPQCTRYFCRECVTEHDGRLMCRGCLAAASTVVDAEPRNWGALVWPLLAAGGWLFVWILAYYVGDLLLRIPNSWHGVPAA
jgi:hypothetical protein